MAGMTKKQFDKVMEMIFMILDSSKDIEEAKEQIKALLNK